MLEAKRKTAPISFNYTKHKSERILLDHLRPCGTRSHYYFEYCSVHDASLQVHGEYILQGNQQWKLSTSKVCVQRTLVKTDRCGLMFLHHEALGSLHHGGIGAHEGQRVLLDLVTEEQCSPAETYETCAVKIHYWPGTL